MDRIGPNGPKQLQQKQSAVCTFFFSKCFWHLFWSLLNSKITSVQNRVFSISRLVQNGYLSNSPITTYIWRSLKKISTKGLENMQGCLDRNYICRECFFEQFSQVSHCNLVICTGLKAAGFLMAGFMTHKVMLKNLIFIPWAPYTVRLIAITFASPQAVTGLLLSNLGWETSNQKWEMV